VNPSFEGNSESPSSNLSCLDRSCFIAVKHASAAMKRNPKDLIGASIVLTASGEYFLFSFFLLFALLVG
jgi:hypothetical protein